MKNSLFKRVAAAAAAVPLALTQCLTFTSAAAGNDAVQFEDNNVKAGTIGEITIDSLLKIDAKDADQKSDWNSRVSDALTQVIGKSGEIDGSAYAEKLAGKAGEIGNTVSTFLHDYVTNTPVKYTVKSNRDVVFTITVSQPDWNQKLAYTPEEALVKLAEQYGLPQLETVDFSSVKLSGTVEITVKTSELDFGTDVPVSVVFKPDGEKQFTLAELPEFGQKKVAELRELGQKAIEENFTGIYSVKKDEAMAKFDEKVDFIQNKLDTLNKKMNDAVNSTSKDGSYQSISEAVTAANNFLAKKNINKKIPTSAEQIAAKNAFKNAFGQAVDFIAKNANGVSVNITAEEVGKFVDSIGSRKITEADGTIHATDFEITVDKGTATLVGAFDDAEAAAVKEEVEKNGYEYIGSYKKITSKVNFKGIDTFNVGDVDVQIERILVTDTTTTTDTETTTTTTETTTTDTDTTTTTTDTETTTTTTETTTSTDTTTTTTDTDTTTTTTETTTSTDTTTTTDTDTTTTTTDTTTTTTESTTTSTDTTTTSTDTTTTSTDTTTESTTTGSDITTVATSVLEAVYVEIDTTHGFYLNTDASFDKGQVKSATVKAVYGFGYTDGEKFTLQNEETVSYDVTDKIGFGSATPANTYSKDSKTFAYDVQVRYEGETIIDKDGKQVLAQGDLMRDKEQNIAKVTAYIGLKGDTDLNNVVDAQDASATLAYYAKRSTNNTADETVLSTSELVNGNAKSIYEDFAAFLTDVQVDADKPLTRFATKADRVIDARDASFILGYYAKASVDEYKDYVTSDPAKLWNIVLGITE